MSITESQRYEMQSVLREKLGVSTANTLVEHLPPSGWSDVATKTDLLFIEERLTTKIATTMATQNKWMAGLFASQVAALIVALAR
ncbi:unannotated protein [freshwater metagenome]|uniref:Unannotated protein n=1 Tax=freshwater metagenome TaxID=449393 RepID=A0A6J7U1E8_9ZZZZ